MTAAYRTIPLLFDVRGVLAQAAVNWLKAGYQVTLYQLPVIDAADDAACCAGR